MAPTPPTPVARAAAASRPPATASPDAAATDRVRAAAVRTHAGALAVSVPWWDRVRYWAAYVALARRGTLVFDPERDAVYEDGRLRRRYDRALERIDRRLATSGPCEPLDVPVFTPEELGPAERDLLARAKVPYVVRGAALGLPAMDWTLESLEAGWGHCTGPINAALDEPSPNLDLPTKAHHYYDFRMGTLGEVAASIRAGGKARLVIGEDIMHADDDRLLRDVGLGHWERYSGWDRNRDHWWRKRLMVGLVANAQLLLQPGGAYSLWHTEGGDNFFVLWRGRKTWTLAHPRYTAAFRPRVKKTTNYTGSNVDVRESDEVQRRRGFAGYPGVPKVRARLEAGDMLRVPSFWWHTVETDPADYTIATSVRVECGPNLTAPALLAMRFLDEQARAMMRAFDRDGRVTDELIGQPRKSRALTGTAPTRPT